MSDLGHYFRTQAEADAARNLWQYAAQKMENAQIRMRLAEIKSQHEPLATLATRPLSERDRLYAAAFYVVVGRMPEFGLSPSDTAALSRGES